MGWWIGWLVGYLALVFAVGIYVGHKVKTSEQYLMGGFNLGFFPIMGTIFATFAGAAYVLGATGKGFQFGISWGFMTSPCAIFSLLGIFLFGAVIRRLKLYTLPDLFVRRFGKASGLIPALIIGIVYMAPTLAMQLVGIAALLQPIFGIPFAWGILIGIVVCTIFTLIGGLPSVAWTDAVQTLIIVAGLGTLLVVGVQYTGGWSQMFANVPHHFFTPRGNMPASQFINFAIIFGPFYMVWQTTWQRISAAKTEKVGMSACATGVVLCFIMGFAPMIVGIAATQFLPADTAPDLVYGTFMTKAFHPALGGFFMVALFAALVTGASSWMISGATNLSKDIYKGWIKPKASDKELLLYSRYSVLIIALIGVGVAFLIKDIITIYTYALSLSAVTLFFPVIAAMFWRRATKAGALTSIFGALIFAIAWNIAGKPFGLHEVIPGLAVSFVLMVIVSLLTSHSPEEEVSAYWIDRNKREPAP